MIEPHLEYSVANLGDLGWASFHLRFERGDIDFLEHLGLLDSRRRVESVCEPLDSRR